jgi:hypothetical protein
MYFLDDFHGHYLTLDHQKKITVCNLVLKLGTSTIYPTNQTLEDIISLISYHIIS